MSLRRPPAPSAKPQTWRRSAGAADGGGGGGELDAWIQHLQRLQRLNHEVSVDQEAPRPTKGDLPSSQGSSSGGTSSLGSEESLYRGTGGIPSAPERRAGGVPLVPERTDSFERARMSQTPRREQSRVSFLTPVRIGWLPVRRRATVVGERGRDMDSATQVKLKQPITPTLLKDTAVKICSDEEERRSRSRGAEGVRTAWQSSPSDKQIPEKRVPAISDAAVSWQNLKRSWRLNRILALPGSSQTKKTITGTGQDPLRTSRDPPGTGPDPLTTGLDPPGTSPDPPRTSRDPPGTSQDRPDINAFTKTTKDFPHRTSSSQPVKASRIETTSATKTLIPENKAGFSSITISSRKVCRSSSLPLSRTHDSTDSNANQVMVQRKATIVKVTQQTMTTTTSLRSKGQNADRDHLASRDSVVHRRKATIIKVTERRESFTHGNASSQKQNVFRHSYSEGLYQQNGVGLQKSQSLTALESKPTHRSTLNLTVSATPAIEASLSPLDSYGTSASRSDNDGILNRKPRPSSCYGRVFGKSEASNKSETKAPAATRKFSLDSETTTLTGAKTQRQASDSVETAPTLRLIKTPDPHQTAEEVLALNAAAIIANIKLQRQRSKKRMPDGQNETASPSHEKKGPTEEHAPSHEENKTVVQEAVKDREDLAKIHTTAFVPLSNDSQTRPELGLTLQEALLRYRPDFVARSRHRTEERERRVQQWRTRSQTQLRRDQLFKPRNRAVPRKHSQLNSKQSSEMKRMKEEESRRDSGLNSRQQAELFKKKVLDEVLQRATV